VLCLTWPREALRRPASRAAHRAAEAGLPGTDRSPRRHVAVPGAVRSVRQSGRRIDFPSEREAVR